MAEKKKVNPPKPPGWKDVVPGGSADRIDYLTEALKNVQETMNNGLSAILKKKKKDK